MSDRIENPNAYESLKSQNFKTVKIVLEVVLDPIPGWGDDPSDHIKVIFASDPYILAATVED